MSATVVLADDEADIRAVYGPCLRAAGYTVFDAVDGIEALALVRAERPELLILDLWMPGLSGFEVLDALRYDPASARLRVIVLSNMGDGDSRLEAFGSGAFSFLAKGVSLAELRAEVARALGIAVAEIDPAEADRV